MRWHSGEAAPGAGLGVGVGRCGARQARAGSGRATPRRPSGVRCRYIVRKLDCSSRVAAARIIERENALRPS